MQTLEEDLYLMHYGIKGMKWGRRRTDEQIAKAKADTRQKIKDKVVRPVSGDAKVSNKAKSRSKSHGTDALSNKELKDLVNRMNMEQQYSQLAKKPSPGRGAGKYIGEILVDIGKTVVTDLITGAVKDAFGGGGSRRGGNFTSYEKNYNTGPAQINMIRKALN